MNMFVCLYVCIFAIHLVSFNAGQPNLVALVEYHLEQVIVQFGVEFRAATVTSEQIVFFSVIR